MAKKIKDYAPTTYLDFSKPAIRRKQQDALAKVRKKFNKEYPLIINGRKVKTEETVESLNPANISEVVGRFHLATRDHAEQAIQAALKTFQSWKNVPAAERADYLFRAAQVIRDRRMEINAWMISEVGKNYLEADADTAEAIDFLEFYGREMLRYAGPHPVVPFEGEANKLEYLPLGVGAVIPPWNFPFAILAGMTTAAIVTGNTVVLKPVERFAGDRVALHGDTSGDRPAEGCRELHPRTWRRESAIRWSIIRTMRFISFTGSGRRRQCASTAARREAPRRTRAGSSAWSPRWAARTRSSSMPRPIWTLPRKALPPARSGSRGRSARPARARSSIQPIYDEIVETLKARVETLRWAIRRTSVGRPGRPARSRTSRSSTTSRSAGRKDVC